MTTTWRAVYGIVNEARSWTGAVNMYTSWWRGCGPRHDRQTHAWHVARCRVVHRNQTFMRIYRGPSLWLASRHSRWITPPSITKSVLGGGACEHLFVGRGHPTGVFSDHPPSDRPTRLGVPYVRTYVLHVSLLRDSLNYLYNYEWEFVPEKIGALGITPKKAPLSLWYAHQHAAA